MRDCMKACIDILVYYDQLTVRRVYVCTNVST